MWQNGEFEFLVGICIGAGAVGGFLVGLFSGWLVWG